MAKTRSARTPRPIVLVFALGKNAKVGKKQVPATYADSACCLYRAADKARSVHLDAIPEDEVADADAEIVFAAIELAIERAHLLHELSTDREIDDGKSPAYTTGFHPNAPFDDACAALERGGFEVVRVVDPLATQPPPKLTKAEALDRSLRSLVRAIDHASLEDVVAEAREEELGFHATAAEDIVERAFGDASPKPFVAGVLGLVPQLAPEARDLLAVIVARAARAATGSRADAIVRFLGSLPAPTSAGARKLLTEWKLGSAPAS